MVARAATSSSDSRNSGRYVRTGASRSTSPRSTRRMIAVAVNVFVIEPIWKSVSGVTSSGCSMLVTPSAAVSSSPSKNMPSEAPGTENSSICARATSTSCFEAAHAGNLLREA